MTTTTITKTLAILCAVLLGACGGGEDEPAAPVDVWQVPAAASPSRVICSASITPSTARVMVTVKVSQTLTVASGSLGLRTYTAYSNDGLDGFVSWRYRDGASPATPIRADDEYTFWVQVTPGKVFTASASAQVGGQVPPGAVLTTSRCEVYLNA